ncbi:MAG: hypothetical protein H6Q73_2315 [Firmicutes bacterium]|nr:hypothetical protein [Bacillota bacterium]
MKKRLILLMLASVMIFSTSSVMARSSFGWDVRAMGMGGAFVAVADDINAIDINPAGLAFLRGSQAEVSFSNADYSGVSENMLGLEYATQLDNGALGVSLSRYKYEMDPYYSSTSTNYCVAYGTKIQDNLAVGAHLSKTKSDSSTNFGVSALYKDGPQLSYGLLIDSDLTVGAAYRPDRQTVVALDLGNGTSIGVERHLDKSWIVRAGSDEGEFTFGVGYKIRKDLRLDYAHEAEQNAIALVTAF